MSVTLMNDGERGGGGVEGGPYSENNNKDDTKNT